MFEVKYETRYGDYKDYESIKTGTVLDIIQDISTKDSAYRGYGINELKKLNRAWLLQGINLRFHKPIKILEPITVQTAVKTLRLATSERGCILKQKDEIVAESISNWFLFDTENSKISKVTDEMISSYEFYDFKDEFFNYKKLKTKNIKDFSYTVCVSNSDIDTNLHLNNQKGADMLMNALPFDVFFNNINLIYKKSAYLSDKLEVCVEKLSNGYYVHLQTKQKEICVAGEFTWN